MKTLSTMLNFSQEKQHDSAVKIEKRRNINYHETLCKYCADNDINPNLYSNHDFDAAVFLLRTYGNYDKNNDYFYFWIENGV